MLKVEQTAGRGDEAATAQAVAPARSAAVRFLYRLLGLAMVGLAIAGVFLPLLPTTPFLIVAAWAFARSSPRLEAWLRNHRQLGPFLRNWEERGAVPRWAKALAVLGCASGWGMLAWRGAPPLLLVGSAAGLLLVLAWLLSRPSA
jgi:uncharacterized membrane protein YbaN (DUF454 family)